MASIPDPPNPQARLRRELENVAERFISERQFRLRVQLSPLYAVEQAAGVTLSAEETESLARAHDWWRSQSFFSDDDAVAYALSRRVGSFTFW